jgi:hypothetical protein
MSVNKTRKHKKVKYNKHKRTNKVANKVANKTKRHRRHRVHKKNKKRATKKHLRGGVNPFFESMEKNSLLALCKECCQTRKRKGNAEDLMEELKIEFNTMGIDINESPSVNHAIPLDLDVMINSEKYNDEQKNILKQFQTIYNRNSYETINTILKKFMGEYNLLLEGIEPYCNECQEQRNENCDIIKTSSPPPLPPPRRPKPPPPKEEEVDLCNPDVNVNVIGKEGTECICKYGSEYIEEARTCLCKEGFEINKRGECIPKPVPEGVYGVTPGLQRRSSKPRGEVNPYAAWSRELNKWRPT